MDTLTPFYFEKLPVRGAVARIDEAASQALAHQKLPAGVADRAAELACATLILAHRMAFAGSIVIQIKGDGPVPLMLAEVNKDLELRVTASVRAGATLNGKETLRELVNATGAGLCSLLADRENRAEGEPLYQTAISLEGEDVASAVTGFMLHSNQIASRMLVASDGLKTGGILLEKLPVEGGRKGDWDDDPEAFERACLMLGTLKREELTGLDTHEILRRLFYEEPVKVAPDIHPRAFCHCSPKGFEDILRMLGAKEVREILDAQGSVTLTCRYCGKSRTFSPGEALKLLG